VHLGDGRIIQTFYLPVSLIPVVRMAKALNQIAAKDGSPPFDWDAARRCCCREGIS
jgi:hypothetical protein